MHRSAEPYRLSLLFATQFAFVLSLATSLSCGAQMPGQKMPGLMPIHAQQTSHGIEATAGKEVLEATVCSDSVIHVVAVPEPSDRQPARLWMFDAQRSCPGAPFTYAQDDKSAAIKTAKLEVSLSLERGNLSFRTLSGEILLNEGSGIPRTYEPVEVNGDATFRVTDRFSPVVSEAFYGLGQHQNGMFNYRGATVELGQNNTDVAMPILVSSKGYALMWNTAALTYVDNRFPLEIVLTSVAGRSIVSVRPTHPVAVGRLVVHLSYERSGRSAAAPEPG